MNVLVTGAAGFLGSHLVNHYLKRGDRVLGVDNFCSSSSDALHHKNLLKNHDYLFLKHDIVSHDFERLVTGFSPRLIMNFACPASPPIYQKIPVETMLACTLGVQRVLELARKNGSIVVHASTSEVYGDPAISPQSESYRGNVNPYGPRACYDEGKRAAEALSYDYRAKHGVDARLVRIFNTYGPHLDMNDGRVVSNFVKQALRGESLTIYGDGSQTRSFCYVDDLIDGITKLASLPENPGTPVNLGNPNEFTVKELALKVQAMFGGKIEYQPLPTDDPMQRRPNISLAKKLLDWEPKIQLDEGLTRTHEYFRQVSNV